MTYCVFQDMSVVFYGHFENRLQMTCYHADSDSGGVAEKNDTTHGGSWRECTVTPLCS